VTTIARSIAPNTTHPASRARPATSDPSVQSRTTPTIPRHCGTTTAELHMRRDRRSFYKTGRQRHASRSSCTSALTEGPPRLARSRVGPPGAPGPPGRRRDGRRLRPPRLGSAPGRCTAHLGRRWRGPAGSLCTLTAVSHALAVAALTSTRPLPELPPEVTR